MPDSETTYTYRNGEKVLLHKEPDQFVVRALPDDLESLGIEGAEQVSSSSSRVTIGPEELDEAMAAIREVAPAHHVYTLADTNEEFLISDRIFVVFREELPPEQVDTFAGEYGLALLERYSDRDYLFQLTDHTGMNPVKLVVKLTEEDERVAAADHDLNQRMTTYLFSPPTDPSYMRQWHLHTHFVNTAFDARATSRCEEAWGLLGNFGAADVVVAVTDDGCKLDHSDFDSPGKFAAWGYLRGTRLVTNADIDASPAEMYQPGSNHGTSCAGVIAGEADALLTVGGAPGCRLLPIQWESSGTQLFISDSKLLTVLNYIADKVDVMSNSWGGVPINLWSSIVVNRIRELAQTGGRRGRGILFLWAAGNENCVIHHDAAVDVPYTSGWQFNPDSSRTWIGVQRTRTFRNNLVGIPGLMHIAALASNGQRSHYSNYGTGILLCAPTNNVHKYLRLSVVGLGITTTTGAAGAVTERFGGTSSATPLTAAVAALVISANPNLTAQEVASVLKRTAGKDLNTTLYGRTPPAIFDPAPDWDVSPIAPFDNPAFQNTGDVDGTWSPWFGHGRVDAAAAVAEALRLNQPQPTEAFDGASAPALAIPDNDPAGVSDAIDCDGTFDVTEALVTVEITHPYIGDLEVALAAPSGRTAVLHNRSGANGDDIRRTYSAAEAPGLAALAGEPSLGAWTLRVRDLARRDVGQLDGWQLRLAGRAGTIVALEELAGAGIPMNRTEGIVRKASVRGGGRVRDVEVALDITHARAGELAISLEAPDGCSVSLPAGGGDHLLRRYDAANTPALVELRGRKAAGTWKLHIVAPDHSERGKLARWGLRVVKDG
jgi:subtilisin-like proprotein convertase family protein/subtilisin family serine protease